ncbi:precorrin-6A/cobalt-precorrin-6A reductase [Rhodoblastus acidophilus]|uniref:cobalt-precorrin-6A reductase n=1 Tax=Rhodoblastus acidophilus TaxID=1074 RepID=UPI0022259C82|nr:cobalt-precorrin-6A reductase [Rhodoblastus acidophilus]MCW2282507.1 precorrin-6A/cobalt-precorrin-6A reductase [Rhodoblastus acidophilus]MCW2331368.1 precorrin-6A/cobalt-precorrin-6A reductase [Rhodoblastus acidophilus]
MRILILGGSSEATLLAKTLSQRADLDAILSLAGRTKNPAPMPLPTRSGGFGGVEGLVSYLRDERINAVIDATHPFAAQMKRNAAQACAATNTPLCAFTRAPWVAGEGDDWIEVDSAVEAAAALGETPKKNVFLAIGRQQAGAFAGSPHHFVLRAIDAPDAEALPASLDLVLARGPFTVADEIALMRDKKIDILVSKNAGGEATRAKIDAARVEKLPVVMIRRPKTPERPVFENIGDALAWIEAHCPAS